MDKTDLVKQVAELFRATGHKVDTSVRINNREIDIRAQETQSLVRKIILIECADYSKPTGVVKIQEDIAKLESAKEEMRDHAVLMHVSRNGYSPDASGYALKRGIDVFSLIDLQARIINFEPYIKAVESESIRTTILKEYQPNRIHFESESNSIEPATEFLSKWIDSDSRWLTLLGDYGVGKSWTLKRFLYKLIDRYKTSPVSNPLPLFIPLQRFTKAFDFENLILRSLQLYGIGGVFYSAFEYMMNQGRIIFLLDSFDEMAQHLARETIRDNLNELLVGISARSRAIMTSRPNYFEGRAERLLIVERDGAPEWHALDDAKHSFQTATSRAIRDKLDKTQFARIQDLSPSQRKRLFEIVLGKDTASYRQLLNLFDRFQNLDSISQRAVIARLLTTVASTLALNEEIETIDGYPLLPDDIKQLNEAKVFEIVIYNLLHRDKGIGPLSSADRLKFLRAFAVSIQQPNRSPFATPAQVRELVGTLFHDRLRAVDNPEQVLENYYRTCRRHSGLTTEGQFKDTSGNVDVPVDELDTDSRVGYSHNSLREYLVADALSSHIKNAESLPQINTCIITDAVAEFFCGISQYDGGIRTKIKSAYRNNEDSSFREILFSLIVGFIRQDRKNVNLLGNPPLIDGIDCSDLDLSGLELSNASFVHSIILDTDFRKSNLQNAVFDNCIIDGIMLDDSLIRNCDFKRSEVISIYAFDEFNSRTTAILKGREARQWLFSRGADVFPDDDLNPLLGQAWYEAAREVAKTLKARIGGSHQDVSLAKGTKMAHRTFATNFVEFLVKKNILRKVKSSDSGPGFVVKLNKAFWNDITEFCDNGKISSTLQPFFDKFRKHS